MADLFISYSRKDTEFVRQLFDRLNTRQREAWIDWRGIDYSTQWWEEICAGIEGADNFVLVISPDALISVYCQREIEHARKQNKRFIPLLYRPIDEVQFAGAFYPDPEKRPYEQIARDNWKYIKSVQWIDYTKIGDLDQTLDALLTTADTDPQRIRMHTQLLLRIRDWEGRGRSPDALLRGEELSAYEQWVIDSDAADNDPRVTPGQREYITLSRAAEDADTAREQQRERRIWQFRRASVVLGVFMIAAVVIGILATVQANTARNDANGAEAREATANAQVDAAGTQIAYATATLGAVDAEAQHQRDLGESLRLANAANVILSEPKGNAETAALLAIRALNSAYSAEADAALGKAAENLLALRTFTSPSGRVWFVAYAPDGQKILTADGDNIIRLWDVNTGDLLRTFEGHTDQPITVVFAPDGQTILSSSRDGSARLWDVATGDVLHTFEGKTGWPPGIAYAPDSQTLLIGSSHKLETRLFDVATGDLLRSFEITGDSVAYAPDGQTILTGSRHYAQLWDVNTGDMLHTFEGHVAQIKSLVYASDGQTVLTCGTDAARLWDINTGDLLHTFERDDIFSVLQSADYAPDGQTVLTGSLDGTARLWDVNTSDLLHTFADHTDGVTSVAYAPDGETVLTGSLDGTARLWAITPDYPALWDLEHTLGGHTDWVTSVAYAPDGETVLTGSRDDTARLWDVETREMLYSIVHTSGITSIAYAPNGQTFLTGGGNTSAMLWDAATGELLHIFEGEGVLSSSLRVAYAPDGQTILAGGNFADVDLWDFATGDLLHTFRGHNGWVFSMTYAPDGQTILTGSEDGTARLWDASPDSPTFGDVLHIFEGHTGWVNSVAFAPDGQTVLTGSEDGTARLWDASPDSPTFGNVLHIFEGHTGWVNSVAFAPDGQTVLTGSEDGTSRLWNIAPDSPAFGDVLRVFVSRSAVYSAAFAPDGQTILTGSEDGTARLWEIDYHDFIDYACTRVFRDLTDDERTLYGIDDDSPTCPQFVE